MLKNRGLVPILKDSEFKLVHPVDLGNWLTLGWQPIAVWQNVRDRTPDERGYESEELEGIGTPFNPPPLPQKSYNYWDSLNDVLYRWDVREQQWVVLVATENSYMTPYQIRDALESLPLGQKLDSSAVENLPLPYSPPIPISDVTNLQTSLENKANAVHNHAIADVSGLSTSLANKANVIHNHAISDVENLQNTLDSKAASVHTHAASNISDLGDVLSNYAPTNHFHEIANISGLDGALDSLDSKVQSSEFKVQNLEGELDNVTSQLTIYDTRFSTIDEELNDFSSQLTTYDLRLTTLNPDDLDDTNTINKFFSIAEREKLANIEQAATGDQTAIEIRDAITSLIADERLDISAIKGIINAANLNGETGSWYRDRTNHTGTQNASTITGLATVATSGNYADLSNRPTIPTTTSQITEGTNLYYTDVKVDNRIAAQKGQASGLAPLGTDNKIPSSYLPAIAITETFVVNTQAAMLALGAQTGDIAVRSDLNKSFILRVEPATTLSNWQELLTPTDTVLSVNGKAGAVTLINTDISGFGTASTYNVPSDGNAASAEVVLGNDTRLTDARTPTAHNHDASAISTGIFTLARIPTIPSTQTSGFGTSAFLNVPAIAGTNAASTEVVRGDDPRLSNTRVPTGAAGGDLTDTFPNPAIALNAVTYAKMQDISASRILGRFAATTGDPQEISISTGLSLNSSTGAIATNDSQINHNALQNYSTNQHIDHSAVSINPGAGLSGGGDLTATRTITLGTPSSITTASTNSVAGTTHSHAITGFVSDTRTVSAGTGLSGGGALSSNVSLAIASTGVSAGTYTKVTVNAQGQATSGTTLVAADIPSLDVSKITTGVFSSARLPDTLKYSLGAGLYWNWKDARNITWTGTLDFIKFVILLHPAYDGTNQAEPRITKGRLYVHRGQGGGAVRTHTIDLDSYTGFTQDYGSLTSIGQGNWYDRIVTCTYNGVKWVAVEPGYGASSPISIVFEGLNTTTNADALTLVQYYNQQTAAVLNSSINSSLVELRNMYRQDNAAQSSFNIVNANSFVGDGIKINNSVLSSDTTVFDYYNEQACTLSLVGTTTAGAVTYTVRVAEWTRTGRQVTVSFSLIVASVTTAPTGNARITGLPFAGANIANISFIGAIRYAIGSNTAGAVAFIGANSTSIDLYAISGGAAIPITGLAAGNFIQGTITYFV